MITGKSILEIAEGVFNVVNHAFISFLAIYLTWICFKSQVTITAVHGWLCALGYQLLMAEAILCLHSGNTFLSSLSRQTKLTMHWVLQVIGSLMAIAGAITNISDKEIHFTTIHGIAGLTATILLVFGLISGLSSLYSQSLKSYLAPVKNKALHILLSVLPFVIGMVSLFYAFNTGFLRRRIDPDFAGFLKGITITIIILTLIGPLKSLFTYSKNIL